MSIEAFSVYRGVVTNNVDPEGLGRVKAIVPQVLGDTTSEIDWAWPVFPPDHAPLSVYQSGSPGTPVPVVAKVPNINDGVIIAFIGGDIEFPVWLGVWN